MRLTVGNVWSDGAVRPRVGVAPRSLKGGYGTTRWVPVGPELRQALEAYLKVRGREGPLDAIEPLFLGRQGSRSPLRRWMAERIIKRVLRSIAIEDNQRLASHSLRKSLAQRVYEASGHNLLIVQKALGHSSVAVTERYLSASDASVDEMIRRGYWSRSTPPRKQPRERVGAAAAVDHKPAEPLMLPGFEEVAACA